MKKIEIRNLIKITLILFVLFAFFPVKNAYAAPSCDIAFYGNAQTSQGGFIYGAVKGLTSGYYPYTIYKPTIYWSSSSATSATLTCSGAFSASNLSISNSGSTQMPSFSSSDTSKNCSGAADVCCTLTVKDSSAATATCSANLTLLNAQASNSFQNKIIVTEYDASSGGPALPSGFTLSNICKNGVVGYPTTNNGAFGCYTDFKIGTFGDLFWMCCDKNSGDFAQYYGYDYGVTRVNSCGSFNGKSFTSLSSNGIAYYPDGSSVNSGYGNLCPISRRNSSGNAYSAVTNFTATSTGWTWNCALDDCPSNPVASCSATKTYSCTGNIPANATVFTNDSMGLTKDIAYTYSITNTAVKCQYSCNSGYAWNGSSCIALPTLSFTANPNPVDYNGATTLAWTTTNAAYCWASGDWIGWKSNISNSEVIENLTATKTYSLECWNSANVSSGIKTVTINVKPCVSNYTNYNCSYDSTGETCDKKTNCKKTITTSIGTCNRVDNNGCNDPLPTQQDCINNGVPCSNEKQTCSNDACSGSVNPEGWIEIAPKN